MARPEVTLFNELFASISGTLSDLYSTSKITEAVLGQTLTVATQSALDKAFLISSIDKDNEIKSAQKLQIEAQTADIISGTTIKEAQSAKDLLLKEAQTDAIISEKEIKETQSAKDLLLKDSEISKNSAQSSLLSAQTDATISEKGIKEAQSAKDLLLKDKELLVKQEQINTAKKQIEAITSEIAIKEAQSNKDLSTKDAQIALINSQKAQYDLYPKVKQAEFLGNVALGGLSGGVDPGASAITSAISKIEALA